MANKTKSRFNGVDLLIIIIFIGCLVGLALRYQLVDTIRNSGTNQKAEVSFYLEDIKSTSEDFFSEGDTFFIVENGERLGVLQGGFVFEPAEEFNMNLEGDYVKSASVNGRSDMRGTLLADGLFTNEGFMLNNTKYIAPGSEITIHSSKIEVTVILTDIKEVA